MKPLQKPRIHQLIAAVGLGAASVVLLLLMVSQVSAQPPEPHDVVFLIDNSPSVLIGDTTGDGTPDGPPTDEQDVRLRLTRFVVNVLGLDPTSASQRVGAISFAGSDPPTQTLMPLTPVRDWSKADFAAIREVDQGSGTDYAAALNAASQILFPPDAPDCSPDVRRCDIIVVTDGFFDNIRRDRPAVEDVLQDLHSRGVSVRVLTFRAGDQDVWEGFRTNTLISTYQPSVTLAAPSQVYGTVLRDLGAETLLADLTPVEVSGKEVVHLKVPSFRTWTRYQILPDSPMTVTFLHAGQVVTPVVAGTGYTFFQPPAGDWRVRLQGEGLAYYRQVGEGVAELSLYLRDLEEYLALGDDAAIRAGLAAGGLPVTDLTSFTVTATISGTAGVTGPVSLEPDETSGLFATTVPSTWFESGVYAVDVAAESGVPGVKVQPAAGQFEVIALPTLTMTVTPTGPVQPGDSVAVTVTVGNWKQEYVPELRFYGPDTSNIDPPDWGMQKTGQFTHTIAFVPSTTSPIVIVAQVAEGETIGDAGRLIDMTRTEPRIVEFTTDPATIVVYKYPAWLLIALAVVLITGGYGWRRFLVTRKDSRDLRRQMGRRQHQIEQLRSSKEDLRRQMGRRQRQIEQLRSNEESLRRQVGQQRRQIEQLRGRIRSLQQDIVDTVVSFGETMTQREEKRLDAKDGRSWMAKTLAQQFLEWMDETEENGE